MIYFTYQLKTNPDGSLSGPANILPANSVTGITANEKYYGKAHIDSISVLTDAGFHANVVNTEYQYHRADANTTIITGVMRRADSYVLTNNSADKQNAENIAFTAYTNWINNGNIPLPPDMPQDPPDYKGFSAWFNTALSVVAINNFCMAYPGFVWFVASHNDAGIIEILRDAFKTGRIPASQLVAVDKALRYFNIPIVIPR